MSENEDQRASRAATAREEEIPRYVHDVSPKVIAALLENRQLREEQVLVIAGRKNLAPELLDAICKDRRWVDSYPVRLALARNPKTSLFTALSIARFLRLFDLADIARSHVLPVLYRKKLERLVVEKIPALALGVKKSLAKVAAGDILIALIEDGYPDVVKVCLENPHLVEASLYKIINRKTTNAGTIRTISEHRTWPLRYHIKFALIRNDHTPLARSALMLQELRTTDLRELYRDALLPPSVRPFIHRELRERNIDPELLAQPEEERVYEVEECDLEDSDRMVEQYAEEAAAEIDPPAAAEEQSGPGEDPFSTA